jgi:hypothetical protein
LTPPTCELLRGFENEVLRMAFDAHSLSHFPKDLLISLFGNFDPPEGRIVND